MSRPAEPSQMPEMEHGKAREGDGKTETAKSSGAPAQWENRSAALAPRPGARSELGGAPKSLDRLSAHAAPKSNPWSEQARQVLDRLAVSREEGLPDAEVRKRRRAHGPNRLREQRKTKLWKLIFAQFKSFIVVLLAAAAGVSFAFGDFIEGLAIGAVIFINAAIGFVTEWRAVR